MYEKNELKEIMTFIEQKYKSFDFPDFSFVEKEMSTRPYQAVVGELRNIVELKEDTDANDDVSFSYLLVKGNKRWSLNISMIGPYAVLMLMNHSRSFEIVHPEDEELSQLENEIAKILQKHSITLLPQYLLEYPVPLQLYNTEPENVKVYQALFTDTDILPWEWQTYTI
ncbi:hypothetical protein HYR99_07340 [Candidatus Poribacteria bacterium]|nr:hypothetical protein [Candidatus Poribacteria bacterium]